jgi:hypothetical protein
LKAAQSAKTLAGKDRARLDELGADPRPIRCRSASEALGRRSLQKLIDEHPPREGKPATRSLGFNEDTATAELIRRCLVDPDLSDEGPRRAARRGPVGRPVRGSSPTAVWSINRRSIDIPLSLTASTSRRSTGDE